MSSIVRTAIVPSKASVAVRGTWVLFGLWLMPVLLAPVWFGSNEAPIWAAHAFIFGTLLAAFGVIAFTCRAPLPVPLSRLALPLAALLLVLLWAGIQVTPFVPSAWRHPVWQLVSTVLDREVAGSISVYPEGGLMAILWTATVGANFILAVEFGRHPLRARLILVALCLAAGANAAYGLVTYMLGNHWVLWMPKYAYLTALTATFIGRNTFATYAGISLTCVTGLLISEGWPNRRQSTNTPMHRSRFSIALCVLLVTAGVLIAFALVLTGSRAGLFASLLGVAVVLILGMQQRGRGWRVGLAAASGVALVIFGLVFAFGHLFLARLPNLGEDFPGRLAIDARVLAAIKASPWLGYGYGAFEQMFPAFRDATIPSYAIWEYAHDDWLEALLALGIPAGLLLWFIFGWILFRCFRAALSASPASIYGAIAVGAEALTLAHALVDFPLQIQGFTIPFMAILGVGVAQSWPTRAAPAPGAI